MAKFDVEVNAPASDLKNEVCWSGVVAEPIETPRFTVLPLKNEATRLSDPVNVLRYANFSARAEAPPREMDRILGKHLPTEPAAFREPDRDLKKAEFSARTVLEPSDAIGDLKREILSTTLEAQETDPPNDLK